MDLIIEIVGEVIIEGIIELIQNKNISKLIRYPLLIIITIFYTLLLALIGVGAIKSFNDNIPISIFLLLVEVLLIVFIIKIIKKAITKKDS